MAIPSVLHCKAGNGHTQAGNGVRAYKSSYTAFRTIFFFFCLVCQFLGKKKKFSNHSALYQLPLPLCMCTGTIWLSYIKIKLYSPTMCFFRCACPLCSIQSDKRTHRHTDELPLNEQMWGLLMLAPNNICVGGSAEDDLTSWRKRPYLQPLSVRS